MLELLSSRLSHLWICLLFLPATFTATYAEESRQPKSLKNTARFRGPVDLVITADESRAVTVNEQGHSVSLLNLSTGRATDELALAGRPSAIAALTGGDVLVSCRDTGLVHRIRIDGERLQRVSSIRTGFEPLGIAVHGQRAFVGLQATGEVAELDLKAQQVLRRFPVGRWPRYLAVSPDGTRLAVGLSGESSIAVVDAHAGELLYEEPLSGGINLGHMRVSSDGVHVYFPWMIYRSNPIDVRNIQRGWVLASRVARIRLDGPAYREAISLDVPRLAVADPFGLALTPNEHRLAITSSGTHELLVYRLADLPFIGAGGPGDLIDPKLLRDDDLFYRIELGGRPMGLRPSRDNQTVYVANYLTDSVQQVHLERREVVRTLSLGALPTDEPSRQVHRGREIFYDARHSLDQWYSCHSCHLDGGSNAKAMDTWNDGTELTSKTVLPLFGVTQTGPWTWHGWQNDLDASLQNSLVSTMQGKRLDRQDLEALKAYLETLHLPPNPFLGPDGQRGEVARRGAELFHSESVGCSACHSGPRFTDGQIHDVGLGRDTDKYEGYNTPSLVGVYRKSRLLHDGRAKTLESVLSQWHTPAEVGGGAELTDQQLADLIEYLKTL